jgi:hypothetical protein
VRNVNAGSAWPSQSHTCLMFLPPSNSNVRSRIFRGTGPGRACQTRQERRQPPGGHSGPVMPCSPVDAFPRNQPARWHMARGLPKRLPTRPHHTNRSIQKPCLSGRLPQADARIRTGNPFITSCDSRDSERFGSIRIAPVVLANRRWSFGRVRSRSGGDPDVDPSTRRTTHCRELRLRKRAGVEWFGVDVIRARVPQRSPSPCSRRGTPGTWILFASCFIPTSYRGRPRIGRSQDLRGSGWSHAPVRAEPRDLRCRRQPGNRGGAAHSDGPASQHRSSATYVMRIGRIISFSSCSSMWQWNT